MNQLAVKNLFIILLLSIGSVFGALYEAKESIDKYEDSCTIIPVFLEDKLSEFRKVQLIFYGTVHKEDEDDVLNIYSQLKGYSNKYSNSEQVQKTKSKDSSQESNLIRVDFDMKSSSDVFGFRSEYKKVSTRCLTVTIKCKNTVELLDTLKLNINILDENKQPYGEKSFKIKWINLQAEKIAQVCVDFNEFEQTAEHYQLDFQSQLKTVPVELSANLEKYCKVYHLLE